MVFDVSSLMTCRRTVLSLVFTTLPSLSNTWLTTYGFKKISAVDDRRDRAHLLHWRDTEGLAERRGNEVRDGKVVLIPEKAGSLARKINARFLQKAERLEVFHKRFSRHIDADVAEGDVARMSQRF